MASACSQLTGSRNTHKLTHEPSLSFSCAETVYLEGAHFTRVLQGLYPDSLLIDLRLQLPVMAGPDLFFSQWLYEARQTRAAS